MKRTLIAAAAAVAAGLAAAYLTGADGTNAAMPQTGASGNQAQKPMTDIQQVMTAPALEMEECDNYILLVPCPVCHTCPVCQSNCGTAHALKCCVGNRKPVFSSPQTGTSGGMTGTPMKKQHIQTNKAEAVKHAAERPAPASQMQTGGAVMEVLTVESD